MSNNVRNALIVLVLILAWLFSGLFKGDIEEAIVEEESSQQGLTLVEAVDLEAVMHSPAMVFNARTLPFRDIELAAETSGPIVSTPVRKGSFVKKGTVIAEIDPEERELRVTESRAELEQKEIEYKAALELKRKNLLSDSGVAQAQAALEAAKANLESSKLELRRTQIRAPYDGVFNERNFHLGDFIQRGQPYAQFLLMDPLRVEFQVTEKEILSLDSERAIEFELFSGEVITGRFHYRSSKADEMTRGFKVEALIDNPGNEILADLTGVVRIYGRPQLAHPVPAAVLFLDAGGELNVKVLNEDNRVESHVVEILVDEAEAVWVTGLPDNARVVVTGFEYVGVGEEVAYSLRPADSVGYSELAGANQ